MRQSAKKRPAAAFAIAAMVLGGGAAHASSAGPEAASIPARVADPATEPREGSGARFYPRSRYAWPYSSGPSYAGVEAPDRSGVLVHPLGTFRLDAALPFPPELTASNRLDRQPHQYFLVQLRHDAIGGPRWQALYATIRENGGEVLRHLPVGVVLARLTRPAHERLAQVPDLQALVPYHPAFKLDASIGRVPLPDAAKAVADEYTLDIGLHAGERVEPVADRIAELGGRVLRVWGDRIHADLHAARLADLAGLEAVATVHEKLPVQPFDHRLTGAVQAGRHGLDTVPYHTAGIRGAGQVLMVLDTGIQLDAGDLSDTDTSPGTPGPSHRKVRFYGPTDPFGGSGDDRGCDAPEQGGFTHGHVVAALALGNPEHAGTTFTVPGSPAGGKSLSGVAPDAALVAYDAKVTPAVGGCLDPLLGWLDVGDLYNPDPVTVGSLEHAYQEHGARIVAISWGINNNSYNADAADVDAFLHEHRDAMVVAAVGNLGMDSDNDDVPDPLSIGAPATAKNIVSVGSHGAPDDAGSLAERSFFSGVGPAGATGRLAPLVMAPGEDRGGNAPASAFACRTADNDSLGAVICDPVTGKSGTSYSAATTAGAALLVRDYFAQGFHPDGMSGDAGNDDDLVPDVSGALVRSILVASAEFLGHDFAGTQAAGSGEDNLTLRHRANREQGFGRIQLDNVLPLEGWSGSVTALLVTDGGIPGGANDLPGLAGVIDATTAASQSATFEVCDDTQELRLVLSWIEEAGDALINDLDLELVAPDGRTFFGNYFTDDDNRDGVVDPLSEACFAGFDDGTPDDNGLDRSPWSLPTCVRPGTGTPSLPPRDEVNPTEGIFLSPNPESRFGADGAPRLRTGTCNDAAGQACGHDGHCDGVTCQGGVSQIRPGTWTVRVLSKGGGSDPAQPYALAVAGGLCRGSAARLDRPAYTCSDRATLTILESPEAEDPPAGLTPPVVADRTTLEVVAAGGSVVDSEPGAALGLEQPDPGVLRFEIRDVPVTDATVYDPGNGVLDVRPGDTIRAVYLDEGSPDKARVATARVDCALDLADSIRIEQFGTNERFFIAGGCERSARGLFEFGFPDRCMDAGEQLAYRIAWATHAASLGDAVVELTCVSPDADSPAECRPGTGSCADPERANNPRCTELQILDPRQPIGAIPAATAVTSSFQVRVSPKIQGTPEVELLLRIADAAAGGAARALLVQRHRLNVDESSVHYSTDFPHGGTLLRDFNNDGRIENPVTTGIAGFPTSDNTDYRFETVQYSDLTQGLDAAGNPVVVNDGIQAPWHFDTNDGGFTSGIAAGTDDQLIAERIAQWGEDKNFNNRLDGVCRSRREQDCTRFPVDPVHCAFCDAASTNIGAPCSTDTECSGGTCDSICINLEDRDPENFPIAMLDQNWSTRGGCGWQTKAPRTCSGDATRGCYNDADCEAAGACTGPEPATGGIWHTGRIGDTTEAECAVLGDTPGQCQLYETIGGLDGSLTWFELLVTPEVVQVNQATDAAGRPLARVEITDWAWNQAIDLPDNNATLTVEFDPDLDSLEPVDLKSDFSVLNSLTGDFGAINGGGDPSLTRGWGLFAPIDPSTGASVRGQVGGNRGGKNACFFENGAVPPANLPRSSAPLPPDDDLPEGYCPTGAGFGGMDPALSYCTTVCSGNPDAPCGDDNACGQGVCEAGLCSNNRLAPCNMGCRGGPNDGLSCTSDRSCRRCEGGTRNGRACMEDSECPDGTCPQGPYCSPGGDADCDLGVCGDFACNGQCFDGACTNGLPGLCSSDADCVEACVFPDLGVDEFVLANGPIRTMRISDLNGPDMRYETLADLAGPAGSRFGGAIGFQIREANRLPEATPGYGVGIDDVVLGWREVTLDEDATVCESHCVGGPNDGERCLQASDCGPGAFCGGGSCATLNVVNENNTSLRITVVDTTPSPNDCDGDGVPDGTMDCDGNHVPDVVVEARRVGADATADFERVILNAARGASGLFEGSLALSVGFDAPGVLAVEPRPVSTSVGRFYDFRQSVRVSYFDHDDGTGRPCGVAGAGLPGEIRHEIDYILAPTPLVEVIRTRVVSDNGDDDGWADPGETVQLAVELFNRGDFGVPPGSFSPEAEAADFSGIRMYLVPVSDTIACVNRSIIDFGELAAGERRFGEQTFEFMVDPSVARSTPFEEVTARFRIVVEADQFGITRMPQTVTLDLDLDATGGSGPTTFFESFEDGFGSFTTMHLDEPLNPPESDLGNRPAGVLNADGWRCQYSDPDWEGSASYGSSQGPQCFPHANGAPDQFFFDTTSDRAFSGTASMSFAIFLDEARGFTSATSQLEAVSMADPINLNHGRVCEASRWVGCASDGDCPAGEACQPVAPELTFKHQISFVDHRTIFLPPERGGERAIVSIQLADDDGGGIGPWIKAYPYVNLYDTLANSNWFSCSFDPTDDGNTEEDFFDPTDPRRSQGPSSTCAPEFSFADQGNTDLPFSPDNVGSGEPGSGLEGAHGIGTWVEPAFDLSRYKGRRLRLRFLQTGIKYGGVLNWEQIFAFNPDPGDDGWFIDDVTVTDALTTPASVVVDQNDPYLLPTCDAASCGIEGGVQLLAIVSPSGGTALPGSSVELDLSGSSVDVCKNGALQFRYWVEVDGVSGFNPHADRLLRDWTFERRVRDAPYGTTDYGVAGRCSTDPDCEAVEAITIPVGCAGSGGLLAAGNGHPFLHRSPPDRRSIVLDGQPADGDKTVRVLWSTAATLDVIRGDLRQLTGDGGFGASEVCAANDLGDATAWEDSTPTPQIGDGLFWLLRSAEACNVQRAGGSYGGVGEAVDRDAQIGACPD